MKVKSELCNPKDVSRLRHKYIHSQTGAEAFTYPWNWILLLCHCSAVTCLATSYYPLNDYLVALQFVGHKFQNSSHFFKKMIVPVWMLPDCISDCHLSSFLDVPSNGQQALPRATRHAPRAMHFSCGSNADWLYSAIYGLTARIRSEAIGYIGTPWGRFAMERFHWGIIYASCVSFIRPSLGCSP